MKTGWWRSMGLCTALAVLTLMASSADASAQVDDRDCRCVDADGDAIENCTCFVMPDVPDIAEVLAWGPDGDFARTFRSVRPRLGMTVSVEQGDALDAQGARVSRVMDGGPADEAGIREGDIITRLDGQSLLEPLPGDVEDDFDLDESVPVQRLMTIARELEPGESVEVGYLRDGEPRTATVEAQELGRMWGAWARDLGDRIRPHMEQFQRELRPQMEELREQLREQRFELDGGGARVRGIGPIVMAPGLARYGLRLTELTPGLGDYFGTDEGVLVIDVDEDSPLGLLPGDVILRIGDREAASPERVRRVLASYDAGESVIFRVQRQGSQIDVMGRLDD